MAQGAAFVTLGQLLEEVDESENNNEILERVKLLAQEHLPEGWTSWKVLQLSKEDIFGDHVDPQVLNKLRFALPTDMLARAFDPEASHLSEKGFRDIKIKLLDWAFARALLLSPPAICNRIRGSAAATELFNKAVGPRPISRTEANRALSCDRDGEPERRKRNRSSLSDVTEASEPKRSRIDALEYRMDSMFSTIMEKIETLTEQPRKTHRNWTREDEEDTISEEESSLPCSHPSSISQDDWRAPSLDALGMPSTSMDTDLALPPPPELDFLPEVKEMEPAIPEPAEQIKMEGIACQRFGASSWNRIRYKEVSKRLHAAPVFSALKVNAELSSLGFQQHTSLLKQDGMLGTISHGLLCQRKKLAEELKSLAKKFPDASDDLRRLLSEGSAFKATSDDLLQFVCAHRAEVIEMRRRNFKASNDALSSLLQQIPPSPSHLFEEKRLSEFIRDQGGSSRVFPPRSRHVPEKQRSTFRQPRQDHYASSSQPSKTKQPTWRSRPAPTSTPKRSQQDNKAKKGGSKRDQHQKQQRRRY